VRRSFEEVIGEEMDRLYRAALFFAAGREDRAEQLMTSAVLEAFRAYQGSEPAPERIDLWLDGHLVQTLLRMEGARAGGFPDDRARWDAPRRAASARIPESVGMEELARAAAALPTRHRIAFWMAVLERRRYLEIAEMLAGSRGDVARWVREAHHWITAELAGSGRRAGTLKRKAHEM
jgi:DNA-directed RNA polymerase specialized sigma24 family protein